MLNISLPDATQFQERKNVLDASMCITRHSRHIIFWMYMHGFAIRVTTNRYVLTPSWSRVTSNNTFAGYALPVTRQSVLVPTQTVGVSLFVLTSRKIAYTSRQACLSSCQETFCKCHYQSACPCINRDSANVTTSLSVLIQSDSLARKLKRSPVASLLPRWSYKDLWNGSGVNKQMLIL
jgi:hypothetical protein